MSNQLGYPASGNTPPSGGVWSDAGRPATQWWGTNGYTMPAGGGIVTDFYIYVGANSGTMGLEGIIWSGSTVAWNGGATAIGAMQWVHIIVPNVYVPAGTVHLGFWQGSPSNVQWQVSPGGTDGGVQFANASGGVSNLGGGSDEYGGQGYGVFGCYILYSPAGVEADNGSSFVAGVTLAADDGTTWHTSGVQLWADDGTTWHQIA